MRYEETITEIKNTVVSKSNVEGIKADNVNILWNASALDIRRYLAYDTDRFYLLTFEGTNLKAVDIYSKEAE